MLLYLHQFHVLRTVSKYAGQNEQPQRMQTRRANFFCMKGSGKKAVVKHLLNFTVVLGSIAAGTLSRIVLSVVE